MNNTWARHKAIRQAIHEQLPAFENILADAKFEKTSDYNIYVAKVENITAIAIYQDGLWHISAYKDE